MSSIHEIDYFSDESLIEDPFTYLDELRSEGPVLELPASGGRGRLRVRRGH